MKKLNLSTLLLVLATGFAGSLRADSTVTFNEIMYHPASSEPTMEWVELRNQMAVDVDISGWSLTGGIQYTFASNTIVHGGGFMLVALSPATMMAATSSTNVAGPFVGRLSNNGDTIRLRNNSGRVVDEVNYGTEGDWPVAPDGSGASLAKRDRDSASGPAANWTASEQMGGTPGAENFAVPGAVPPDTRLIGVDAVWKYEASGTDLGSGWSAAGFNDSGWSSRSNFSSRALTGLFNTGVGANGVVLANNVPDPHYIITANAQGGTGSNALAILNHPNWLANDSVSSWIGIHNPGADTINGGNYNFQTTFSLAGVLSATARLNVLVAVDNDLTDIAINGTSSGLATSGFATFNPALTVSSGFVAGVNTVEFRTVNQGAGPGAFRATLSGTALGPNTNAPLPLGRSTYYFRKSFTFSGDPAYTQLRINPVIGDGAVVYLNGVEVFRQNMPPGAPAYGTAALADVAAPDFSGLVVIPAGSLVGGNNVLAVETHQAAGSPDGPLFGAELISTPLPVPAAVIPKLAFNEFSATTNAEFWLELANYGTNNLPLAGFVIVRDGAVNNEYVFPGGPVINAGVYRAVTNTTLGFHPVAGDKLYLLAPARDRVLDAVVLKSGPRARYPAATGPYLRPSAPSPGGANTFAFHNEIVINEIMYHPRPLPPINGEAQSSSKATWLELYNRGGAPVDLTGWELGGGISYLFTPGKMIAPGAYLVVAKDAAYLRTLYPAIDIVGDFSGDLSHRSDSVILKDPSGNPANEVRYYSAGRWPEFADGGGSSLELRDPNSDNAQGEAWAASDETGKSSWQNYSYKLVASVPSGNNQPTVWNEFILGLLADGECLIDDLTVVESPTNGPVQMIANGDFESGQAGWRTLGTHVRSRVEPEPGNPGNHVLHVITTGPQEHMHNHIETSTIGYRAIVATREYQISYRARWLAGNNLLNTRLYFNRSARTMALPVPALNGTPGAQNSRYAANLGPTFSQFRHSPVIPQPAQPVTVSVVATDPQNVASAEVWWSANGGAWTSAAMSPQGSGLYSGTIPGFAAPTTVQFYVRAVDGLGAAATYPDAGTNSGALYSVSDGQAFLTPGHNIRIILTANNTDLLHASTNVMSNDRLPCTVVYDETRAYYNVGVRLKGSERGRPNSERVSYHLEFPPDDPFRGVHPYMLVDRSGAGDTAANKQQEILIKHILWRAGDIPSTQSDMCRVIAPRTAHTGPALLSPRHEDEFIETAYDNGGDGSMWELELIYYPLANQTNQYGYKFVTSPPNNDDVRATDIGNLGDDKEFYRYNFIIKNHRDEDDYSPFITFAKTFSLTNTPSLHDAQTRQVMDVNEWARAYALESLCGVGDSYTFGNNHNLFMYSRPSDGKFVAFPVDMDFSFSRGSTATLIGDQGLSFIFNLPANKRCFYAHVLDIIATSYNTSYMTYWVNHYQSFAPGQNYQSVLTTYMPSRITTALSEINAAGGNAPFTITASNFVAGSTNLISLSGTAPVQVKSIWINGIEYVVTWTSVSAWTLRLPVSDPTNVLNIVGHDLRDNALTNFTRTVTVNYGGPAPDPAGKVVINEIMYNPIAPDASFVELFNSSSNLSFDLSGWQLNGMDFTFPDGSILTNRGFLVVSKSMPGYVAAYGTNAPVSLATYDGQLQNDGETLTLFRPGATTNSPDIEVDKVRYESTPPWPGSPNGGGTSLQLIDATQDNSRVGNWSDGLGWRQVRITGSIGSTTNLLRLYVYLDNTGDLYLDDFYLVQGSVAEAGVNLIRDGDFEGTFMGPWNIINNTNQNLSTVTTTYAHSGSSSLHLISVGAGTAATNKSIWQDIVDPVINTTYTFSFWYLPTTNANLLTARTAPGSALLTITSPRPIFSTPNAPNSIASTLPPFPPLWLNEAQPENLTGLQDHLGDRDPWVEIYNAGTGVVSLTGCYLTTNYGNLTLWAFPPGAMLQPGEFKVVFCDGEPGETTTGEWHTNFRLNPGSGSVGLVWTPGAAQVLDYLNYTNIPPGRGYGDYPDGQPFTRQEFFHVTPGGANDNTAEPLVVFINEWMAANTSSLINTNNNNKYDDWFELYNPGSSPANLAGYFLTDNLSNKFQYAIPSGFVIPPHGFKLVWADGASGLNNTNNPDLHVSFKLSQNGEQIGLFAIDGTLIDAVTFEAQFDDYSQGRYPDGPTTNYFLATPTPRGPNTIWANRYPTLEPIANTTAYLDTPFTFTAAGADPDAPPQSLIYSLDSGAPLGAGINPTTGAFSWTPTALQTPGTNVLTVRVTDNGVPVLSAARTFTVVTRVPLLLSGVMSAENGNFQFTIGTVIGKTYRVEYKEALGAGMWMQLGPDHVADATTLVITDNIGSNLQRFYRVLLVE